MNIKFIKYIALASVLALGSCSKDYLETYPTDETSPSSLFKTTDGVKMAVNGMAKIMTNQHLRSQGFNGEGTIKMYYGEYAGSNFRVDLPGWSNVINGELYQDKNSTYNYYPWHYYYMIIMNANEIVAKVDGAEGPIAEKQYLKAQALSYRAYAYTMLSQIYGYRWDDSGNGSQKALILRLSPDDAVAMPLSSLNDVFATIYKDLDTAITLFTESGYSRKTNYEMDANVSKAIYARAALIKKDYAVAAKYAAEARVGYALMSVKEYKDGFANPTSEWIWSSFGAGDENLHFYSYQAYIAYNSSASAVRSYPKRMSVELYNQIPTTDIRKGLFLNGANYAGGFDNASGKVDTKLEIGKKMDADARAAFPDLKGNATVAAYMQFKIKANEMPGVGNLNHFRSSEMYLIEAEAKHFLGDDAGAALLLEELTAGSGRDEAYTCTKVGAELFKEIVKYRGIELWGEGFDWFDMKRWNMTITRKSAGEGGNYPAALAVTINPDKNNKWTWVTPAKETDFNPSI